MIRSLHLGLLGLTTLTTLAGGCYNPDLGDTPFLCAPTGKACPEGYSCINLGQYSTCVSDDVKLDASPREGHVLTDAELMPSKEGPVYLDGHPPQSSSNCMDKSTEPNNTGATATKLPASSALIPGWQICYPGDVDQFAVELTEGAKIAVTIKFFDKNGDLDAALVNPDGMVIDTSRTEDDDEELGVSAVAKAGTYIIGVYGFGDATNTYSLDLTF